MTPAARAQAAIELLDAIIAAARDNGPPADRILRDGFKARRYAGSKDRRAVSDLVYRAVRRFGEMPPSGRAAIAALADEDAELAACFMGGRFGPEPLTDKEPRATGGPVPAWLEPLFAEPEGGIDRAALLDRAPLDLRVNALKAERAHVMALLPEAEALAASPYALRLATGASVEQHPAYAEGLFEVQDLGSQLIVDACGAGAGMTVLDLCAGAGGKTLALAAAMRDAQGQPAGRLIAADTNARRLGQLAPRAARAGADFIETVLLDPNREAEKLADLSGACDLVLVDAPCSGSGTWRRNPETRWRLTPARLAAVVAEQARLLDIAAACTAPGGLVAYAVCSLLEQEGAGQFAAFLARQPDFAAVEAEVPAGRRHGEGCLLTPCHDGSDGFFFALARKKR